MAKDLTKQNVLAEESDIEAEPIAYELTKAQSAFLRTLKPVPKAVRKKLAKAPQNIAQGFDGVSMRVVKGASKLGGKERVDAVEQLITHGKQLKDVMNVVEPLYLLIHGNQLLTRATLATHMSEVINSARSNRNLSPALLEGIAKMVKFSKDLHPGRGKAKTKGDGNDPAK